MKCRKCGREAAGNERYCIGCGSDLWIPAAQRSPYVTKAAEKKTQAEKYADKKKKNKVLLICCAWGIVLVALLALLLGRRENGAGAPTENAEAVTEEASVRAGAAQWSGWLDALPADVSRSEYQIETKTQYRARSKETTSAAQETLDGWTLVASATGDGGFGAWSDWGLTSVAASDEREVQTQTRYRYREKETTASDASSLSGWEQYDASYTWGDYGAWSDWSTAYVSSSDSRMVEAKKQYRYRDIRYEQKYSDWSGWSAWESDYFIAADNLTDVQTRTTYGYYWFECPNCGAHMHGYGFTCPTWAYGCGQAELKESGWRSYWSTTPPSSVSFGDWFGTTHYYAYVDGILVFRWDYNNPGPRTEYRCRTRSAYREASYGTWSGWSDTRYSASSSREVESREVYRYRDRAQTATYHYARWGDWSGWTSDVIPAGDNREVETATFYRYRDRVYEPVYFFERWSDWGAWSGDAIEASDTVEVEEKVQYRYRRK